MIHWIKAARLRTLPLSISGIIIGSFIAKWRMEEYYEFWNWQIFPLAILVTLLYQILSNFANDYGDGIKGTDQFRDPLAEKRAVASGHISEKSMKIAVVILAILSLLATVLLLFAAFFPDFGKPFYLFLGLGVACILAAIGYTIGKKPYGYLGLGDLMVFIFFGLVSVCGSYFLFTKSWSWDVLLPATAVGMMSMAVLNLNNMRDIVSDEQSGKKTLALRLGFKNAMIYEIVLLQFPLLLILTFLMINNFQAQGKYYAFIVMILIFPLLAIRRKIMAVKEPRELDPYLKQVGLLTLVMAILLAIGINYFK